MHSPQACSERQSLPEPPALPCRAAPGTRGRLQRRAAGGPSSAPPNTGTVRGKTRRVTAQPVRRSLPCPLTHRVTGSFGREVLPVLLSSGSTHRWDTWERLRCELGFRRHSWAETAASSGWWETTWLFKYIYLSAVAGGWYWPFKALTAPLLNHLLGKKTAEGRGKREIKLRTQTFPFAQKIPLKDQEFVLLFPIAPLLPDTDQNWSFDRILTASAAMPEKPLRPRYLSRPPGVAAPAAELVLCPLWAHLFILTY